MTVQQIDALQRLARRLNAISLAVSGLGNTPAVDATAELILETAAELGAVAASGNTCRRLRAA